MKTSLQLSAEVYENLLCHLFPSRGACEEAAFLFVEPQRAPQELTFSMLEIAKLQSGDFAARHADYLELTDIARARIIKRAHDLKASLVEIHSHVGPWRAAFSYSDVNGLKDTVPHMWWRLQGRPYVAIVFARDGADALVWVDNPHTPVPLDELRAGERLIRPSCTALEEWS